MKKNIFTIPPDAPFLKVLAEELWKRAGQDAAKLSDMLVLLPTRRSCRALIEAFASIGGKPAALLPRMRPLGDIDEEEFYFAVDNDTNFALPPAINPMRRQLLLTRLIKARDQDLSFDQAAQMAIALAQFLDQAQIEDCDLSRLKDLVVQRDLAEHWQETLEFLDILTKSWPQVLASEGCMDPAERRGRLLRAQADIWRKQPPSFPVIAAGSTGTVPATAELLDVIASLPQGAVVLPGLDQEINEEAWQEIKETHPQYNLKKLLEKCGMSRDDVRKWSAGSAQARARLLQNAMLPAEVSEQWSHLAQAGGITADAAKNLSLIEADHPQEEAQAIALILRRALDTDGKTAALITPDRSLAERVCALLSRWDIRANDSGGANLVSKPAGSFLCDVLEAAKPTATSVDILSLLKHPYAACGLDPAECRARVREVEITVFRAEKPEHSAWLQEVKEKLQELGAHWQSKIPLREWLTKHRDLAEKLASTDRQKGADILWQGDAGEDAGEWWNDWLQVAQDFDYLTGADYADLFMGFIRAKAIRPRFGQHPRLSIWGTLEARLMQPDLVVLGGLNEGVWPPEAEVDPWMSRPMKKDFGLPSPERVIGLSAHDFVQLASAPEVVLTRSKRAGTSPTVPSRFILQLQTVLKALKLDPQEALAPAENWLGYARMMDEEKNPLSCAAPDPKPPVAMRPTTLSVTEIGTWRRNPYAIYARHILKLKKLDPLEMDIDAADRGSLVHEALDRFVKQHPTTLPSDAFEKLIEIGRTVFAAYDQHPEVRIFWWPRFERIAAWFIEQEQVRRDAGIRLLKAETDGHIVVAADFTLKGRADRIDQLPEGKLGIIDYKTGAVPSNKQIEAGFEPQMPLLMLIAERGGFAGVPAGIVGEMAYWKLSGGAKAGEEKQVTGDAETLGKQAEEGLKKLIILFADPATPYQAVPKPQYQPRYDDYAHLARLGEWGRVDSEGGPSNEGGDGS